MGERKALGRHGYVALNRGDHQAARAFLTRCIMCARDQGLNDLPKWLYVLGRLCRASGVPLPLAEQAEYMRDVALVRRELPPEALASAQVEGEAMDLEQAIAGVPAVQLPV